MSIFTFAVRKPVFFFLVMIFVAVTGVFTFMSMPVDTNPEIQIPVAVIITIYPGATARESETVITNPMEAELKSVKGIKEIFSTSRVNVSATLIFFEDKVKPKEALEEVRSRVARVQKNFPEGVWEPDVKQVDFGELPLHVYGLTPRKISAREFMSLDNTEGLTQEQIAANRNRKREIMVGLTEQANRLREQLLTNPYVDKVYIVSMYDEELTIQINPFKLQTASGLFGIGVDAATAKKRKAALGMLQQAINEANLDFPAGQMRTAQGNIQVRSVGKFTEISDIESFIVYHDEAPVYQVSNAGSPAPEGRPAPGNMVVTESPEPRITDVRVTDIADVFVGVRPPEQEYYVIQSGSKSQEYLMPMVGVYVIKKHGSDIFRAANSISDLVNQAKAGFLAKEDIEVSLLHDGSWTAKYIMSQLKSNAYVGAILVIGILLFFLGFSNSILVSFAIPLSILMALIIIRKLGFTINQVTIFGVVLAIGMIVDDTIVVVANIYRHKRMGKTRYEAAYIGPMEIGIAVVGSSLATMSAFFPILLLPGVIGQYMSMIPITVILCMASSLFVALFIAPVLCSWFLTGRQSRIFDKAADMGSGSGGTDSGFTAIYKRGLRWALHHRWIVITMVLIAFGTALFSIRWLGLELFPQVNFNRFYVDIEAPVGSNKSDTMKVVEKISGFLSGMKELESGFVCVGSTGERLEITDMQYLGDEFARVFVNLVDESKRQRNLEEVIEDIRSRIKKDPGLAAMKDLKITFSKQVLGPPMEAPVVVRLQGSDVDVLREPAEKIRKILAGESRNSIPGVVDVKTDAPSDISVKKIIFDHDSLREMGVNVKQAGILLWVFFNGGQISTFDGYTDPKSEAPEGSEPVRDTRKIKHLPIWIRFPSLEEIVQKEVEPSDISMILTQFPGDHDIEDVKEPDTIEHYGFLPTITIRTGVLGRRANMVKDDIMKLIDNMRQAKALGHDVQISMGGEDVKRLEMFKSLSSALLMALALIYLFLCLIFRSMMQPLIVLFTVPLALIGVVIGLAVTGSPFGMLAFIGIVALSGIVSKNAVVLVDFINTLRGRGMAREEAIVTACPIRMVPVFLTSATTVLGILPLTLGIGGGGSQFWRPLGWAIIFGLSIAWIMTFFVIPVVYTFIDDIRSRYGPKPVDHKTLL